MRAALLPLCIVSTLAGECLAQSVVVPFANAAARGSACSVTVTNSAGRTYMVGIPASELTGIPPGSLINGVSFRLGVGTAGWPAVDTTWLIYDITVGYALPMSSWTTTFASNFVNTPIAPLLVRTGPMVIEANAFPNNPSLPAPQPNVFSDFFFDFQKTLPYVGGDLGIFIVHNGSNQAGTSACLDYVASAPPGVVGYLAQSYQAASGTLQGFNIARVHYGYGGGCPGTGGMVPMLVLSNNVAGGGSATLGIANAPAGGVALQVVGARSSSVGLGNGCTLLANPTVVLPAVLSSKGRNLLTTSFPPGLSLTAYAQAFVIDAGAPGGFSATNGVTLTVSP
jgi:hypothetical protein